MLKVPELVCLLSKHEFESTPFELTTRQRLILRDGARISAEEAMTMEAEAFCVAWMLEHGVSPTHVRAAELNPHQLWHMGAVSAADLRRIGLDALDLVLCSNEWLRRAIHVWGKSEISREFGGAAIDAVALAGSEAGRLLGLSTARLLEWCVGFPGEAEAVISQQGAHALDGVPMETILATGIKRDGLARAGVDFFELLYATSPPPSPSIRHLPGSRNSPRGGSSTRAAELR